MPGYNSKPPPRFTSPTAKKRPMGTRCPQCGLIRPAGWVGMCRSCLDDRDAAKREGDE